MSEARGKKAKEFGLYVSICVLYFSIFHPVCVCLGTPCAETESAAAASETVSGCNCLQVRVKGCV